MKERVRRAALRRAVQYTNQYHVDNLRSLQLLQGMGSSTDALTRRLDVSTVGVYLYFGHSHVLGREEEAIHV